MDNDMTLLYVGEKIEEMGCSLQISYSNNGMYRCKLDMHDHCIFASDASITEAVRKAIQKWVRYRYE